MKYDFDIKLDLLDVLISLISGIIISYSLWKFLSINYPDDLMLIAKGCFYYVFTSLVMLIYSIKI